MKNELKKELPLPNRTVRYTFRLTEAQNTEFLRLVDKAGCGVNRSRFIVGRLLDWKFTVVRKDTETERFYSRLNDFYYQFKRVGNNFNQVVKSFHTHFSAASAAGKLRILEQDMARLTAISERILSLADRFEARGKGEDKE